MHHHTYQEYLAYERDSGLKHEYEDGEIYAMAGGSRRHSALASRMSAAIEASRGTGCIAFQSDQKVRVLATGKATFPDASMVCGAIEGDPADPLGTTVTNPMLLVEVLSPSTEQEDRVLTVPRSLRAKLAFASLAIEHGSSPRAVNVETLQAELLRQKAILIYYADVPPGHPRFADVQRAGLRGDLPAWKAGPVPGGL